MVTKIPASTGATAGYPLVGGRRSRAERLAYLTALGLGVAFVYLYRLYAQSADMSPDSAWGYAFAIAGSALLALVGGGYALRKRRRRRARIRLHTALAWHVAGGLIGISLIFMHAAGNFNPRSGTYALYGLIAVVLSGIIGRLIDRVCPRLAAAAAARALTDEGQDRLGALQRKLTDAQRYHETRRAARRARQAGAAWDLAYYDLDPEIEAIPDLLSPAAPVGDASRARGPFGPLTERLLGDPRRLGEHILHQATAVREAMGYEQFGIQMVRAWRRLHALLCLVALGLLIWHLVYAATLLMNAR